MESKIIIQGALANIGPDVKSTDFLNFMRDNISDADYYILFPKSGQIMAAAFDWSIVINSISTISGLITIAGFLWQAYTHFFKTKKSDGFLIIQVKTEKNVTEQFILGKEYIDEASFIKSFSEKVEKKIISSNPQKVEDHLNEIINSELWKKIND